MFNKFVASCGVAAYAAAVDLTYTEEIAVVEVSGGYEKSINVLPDADIAVAMAQGKGRDHTDWSWMFEHKEAQDDVREARIEVGMAETGLKGALLEYEEVKSQIISAVEEHTRQCQLHREEEMNLYYQCTQNDINNYALHHFGGAQRSYPRWVTEYNVCIDHLQSAKWLWLDYYHEDGSVTLEPCSPQDHSSPVYIHQETQDHVHVEVEPKPASGLASDMDPTISCEGQGVPDISGLYIMMRAAGGEDAILSGEMPVPASALPMCFTVNAGTTQGESRLVISQTTPSPARVLTMFLAKDTLTERECMLDARSAPHDPQQVQMKGFKGPSTAYRFNERMMWNAYGSMTPFMRIGDCDLADDLMSSVYRPFPQIQMTAPQ